MSEQIEIQFSGTLTKKYLYHLHHHYQPIWFNFFLKWLPWIFLGLMIYTLLSILGYISVSSPLYKPGYISVNSSFLYNIFLLLFLFFMSPWLFIKRQIKKILQSNKLIQGNFSGVATEPTLFWNSPYGESIFPWDAMLKYKEAKNTIILDTVINQTLIIPRNFFYSEEDWQQFRRLVISKVPKK
ncbi:hypothetical protein Sta7437_2552 [Stanieria cyanosphaera PCC 7437]|uniref:YcxB-like C-terminal domain-containing protein n=1 Tax=Stanieria cyanosphaera (strain ATCC 29371 / PCC 7437) TaxID=111780 RepID=K9XVJ4_STAC7|nr:YcxB family protein [Stanieria cyanosphaera]AFZ36084.1 hypothetical protein Sta7437_2552 [Stanieria cyanosphaera PCC 7437]